MIQQLILSEVRAGAFLEACDGTLCRRYRILRIRETGRGKVLRLAEVAGSLAVDPLIALYDELLEMMGKKQAVLAARTKFGLSRSQFYRRLAAR